MRQCPTALAYGIAALLVCGCVATARAQIAHTPGSPAAADVPRPRATEEGSPDDEEPADERSDDEGAGAAVGTRARPADVREERPAPPPDRPLPDYDGLPEPGDDAGDVFLWMARVLTAPLYFVTEFILRRPLVWVLAELERNHVVSDVRDFFTFGPDDNIILYPTFLFDFGFQPSVGIYATWNDFLGPGNRISTHGAFGGTDWLTWTISDELTVGRWQIGALFSLRRRPDYVFGGIGADATQAPRARFSADVVETSLWTRVEYWRASTIEVRGRYRNLAFASSNWNDEPSVPQQAAANRTPVPFGYSTGYDTAGADLLVDLDSRPPNGPPEGGVRIAAQLGQHAGFGGLPGLARWLRWGGSAMLATDVLGLNRVMGITIMADFVTPADAGRVPFTELIDVGGEGPLRGFLPGRIRGYSATALSVHYTWPIWAFLDARLCVATGNAFDEYLDGFDVARLRLSFALQLIPRLPNGESPFQMELAFATDTFDGDGGIDSVRFVLGNRNAL